MSEVKVIIDQNILDKYYIDYFIKYPRRKKRFITRPVPMSLNRFIAMTRIQQNATKQNYKEFATWLASYYHIANLNLNRAKFIYTFYFKDHRRRDQDNMILSPKFLNDGFVNANVITDDSGDILRLEFDEFKYDKFNPRVEIKIIY